MRPAFGTILMMIFIFSISYGNETTSNKDLNQKQTIAEIFNPFDISYEEMNASSMLGTTIVASYAGSGYFFGDGSLWNVTSEAAAPDSVATFTQLFPNDTSRYLYVKDFAFNIPCNATVTNLTFRITRQNSSAIDVQDALVSVYNPNTLSVGSVNLKDATLWIEGGVDWETITYSHANWGETLTPELLNDSRFGLIVQAEHLENAGLTRASIDAIEMEVCYNVGVPYANPITFASTKVEACYDEGEIIILAAGGSGTYEYSIDNGTTWQLSETFSGLSLGDYIVVVRNSDGTCETERFYCNLSGDNRILQAGDAIVACATFPGNRVTLAIEKLQPMHDLFIAGETGYDISFLLPNHPHEWDVDDLLGEIYSFSVDKIRNIYTATTMLYDLVPGVAVVPIVSKIDAFTGAVTILDSLPGDAGATSVEFDTICEQIYVGNLGDGMIYRIDPNTGTTLSTFDPGVADNGAAGMAPMGERILGLGCNAIDGKLYYSVWASDFNKTNIRNSIRSISIDPGTCDFLPGTDQLEITLPWTQEYGDPLNLETYSMPVGDIEFSADGMTMLLGESGFDSTVPNSKPHESRVLRYIGNSGAWVLQTAVPPGNFALQHELGEVSAGLNARGGVDFANSGMDNFNCSIDNDLFIIATADALRGADCNTLGCLYGLQYLPITGGNSMGSVLLDIARDVGSQQKGVFGDVDVIQGCLESLLCCPEVDSPAADQSVCEGTSLVNVDITGQADSMELVYFTSIPADSSAVYIGGTPIDTVDMIAEMGTFDLSSFPISTPGTYYVYAIVFPTPTYDYCRPYDSLIVTIFANPSPTITDPADVCIDGADLNFTGGPLPGGGATGVFTTDAPGGLTDNNDGTAVLDVSVAGTGTFDVIYTYTDVNSCFAEDTASVTIFNLPAVSLNDPADVCVDGLDLNFTGSPIPVGFETGVFTTTAPAGLTDNNDGTAVLDIDVATPGTYDVTYTFTTVDGCIGSNTVSVTINTLPVAGLNDPADECVANGPMLFTGSPLPGGGNLGVFTTTAPAGLMDNNDGTASLDVGLAGAGFFDVTYTYTDVNGCQDAATVNVQIYDTLANVIINPGTICGNPVFGSNFIDLNSLITSGPLTGT